MSARFASRNHAGAPIDSQKRGSRFLLEFHLRSDLDRSLYAPGHRTLVRVYFQHPGRGIAHLFRHPQFVFHVHPPQDEDTAVLLNLANHLRNKILGANNYLARTQRAGKCAR